MPAMDFDSVTIRLANGDDAAAIATVAQRDTSTVPPAPHLVAERDGAIQAVLSLRNAAMVADPFILTAELVDLLRRHARNLDAAEPARRRRRIGFVPRYLGAGGRA
jgi:hypothetical protein